jgi:capsular exopolysaccharide synthesis family protein
MGRIDEAMNRAKLDAGQGTGAAAPTPAPPPWEVEPLEGRGGTVAAAAAPAGAATDEAPERPAAARRGRTLQAGAIPAGRPDFPAAERLVVSPTAGPLLVEQFRRLAATLLSARGGREIKSILVTSPAPGDGKSNVAVNLSLTLSESYHRSVLLIDADLRRPTLHALFGVHNTSGLAEALKPGNNGKVATVQVGESLTLLPAGRPDASPLGGLASDRLKHLIVDAGSRFDWVIVDSPPVGLLADAHLVSEAVDGALLVVRAGVTPYPDMEGAAGTLGHERILGIVLNAVDPAEVRGEGYYSHYYGRQRDK